MDVDSISGCLLTLHGIRACESKRERLCCGIHALVGMTPQLYDGIAKSLAQERPTVTEATIWENFLALIRAQCAALKNYSIPVGVGLEGPVESDADIISLFLGGDRHLSTQRWDVQAGHLLVEILGQEVHVVLVALLLGLQEVKLRKHLVGEGARHD